MSSASSFGLRAKIVVALAVVLALFIVLTDAVVLGLGRVSLERSSAAVAAGHAGGDATAVDKPDVEAELGRLRRLVLFYMITGAAVQ